MAQSLYKNVYLVRSRPDQKIMRVKHDTQSYAVGFLNLAHAESIRANVSQSARVAFIDYYPQSFSIVSVEKRIDINKLPCYVQPTDFLDFMSFPFRKNLSILFVFDIIDENKKEFVLETQTFDALYNPTSFRESLSNYGSNLN